MNLKISVDRPSSQHRAPRKPVTREPRAYASAATAPTVAPTALGPTVAPSALATYGQPRKIEALRHQQVTRRVPRPKLPEPEAPQPSLFGRMFGFLGVGNATPKQLQVIETVQLGEKRFVAILQAEGRKYLIGGGTQGVSLLTTLDDETESVDDFENVAEMAEPAE